jgi:3-oxoadipate enol-lactonase/4-carboxymuconolactone decarboxylase
MAGNAQNTKPLPLHVTAIGEGPPALCLPGLGLSAVIFSPLAPHLPEVRLVLVDNPGAGASPAPKGDYTIQWMADCIVDLINRMSIAPCAVIGHSMGGFIALQLALDHPDLVSRMALIASSPVYLHGGLRLDDRGDATRIIRANLARLTAPAFREKGDAFDRLVDDVVRTAGPGRGFAGQLAAARAFDVTDRLQDIRCDALILHGAQDAIVPESTARFLHDNIYRSQLAVIEAAGHLPTVETPEETAALLRAFIGQRP